MTHALLSKRKRQFDFIREIRQTVKAITSASAEL